MAPEMAKSVITLSVTRKKVATAGLDVAWYHISRAGNLCYDTASVYVF